MRTSNIVVEKEVERAKLGSLIDPEQLVDIPIGQLHPYLKSREDLEVLMRYPTVLNEKQPLEFCGLSAHTMLKRATSLQVEIEDTGLGMLYNELVNKHPVVISYPFETVWLGLQDGINKMAKNMEYILPSAHLGLSKEKIEEITSVCMAAMIRGTKSYGFWRAAINNKIDGDPLSEFLIEWVLEVGVRTRAKYTAGLVPVIDSKTPGSVNLSHQFNLAYASVVEDRLDGGLSSPKYLYTIGLNPSMIKPDQWHPLLDDVIRNVRVALRENIFNGVHISLRGLPYLSQSNGRVNVLEKFIKKINDVATDHNYPTWWSRLGPAGLAALDHGSSFSSFPVNMNMGDVFFEAAGIEKEHKFGKIVNTTMKEIWARQQVILAMGGPQGGLPPTRGLPNAPTSLQQENFFPYRIHFSKPYNTAVMSDLSNQWIDNIEKGETVPGKQYLKDFENYSSWGVR